MFINISSPFSDQISKAPAHCQVDRVFANSPGDRDPIPCRVISKTQKMVLDTQLLNIQHYKVRIKGKWSNPGKGVVHSPTPQCSSYCKGSLRVANFTYIYIYIYIKILMNIYIYIYIFIYIIEGAHGVMVIVAGNGYGDTSSNPGRDWLHFIYHLGKVWIQLFSLQLWINSRAYWVLQPWWGN